MIYTSYFELANDLDRNKFIVCSILGFSPRNSNYDYQIKSLVPPYWLDNKLSSGEITQKEFVIRYRNYLINNKTNDIYDIANSLKELSEVSTKDVVLCGGSKDGFSVRHILADILSGILNIKIEELVINK